MQPTSLVWNCLSSSLENFVIRSLFSLSFLLSCSMSEHISIWFWGLSCSQCLFGFFLCCFYCGFIKGIDHYCCFILENAEVALNTMPKAFLMLGLWAWPCTNAGFLAVQSLLFLVLVLRQIGGDHCQWLLLTWLARLARSVCIHCWWCNLSGFVSFHNVMSS